MQLGSRMTKSVGKKVGQLFTCHVRFYENLSRCHGELTFVSIEDMIPSLTIEMTKMLKLLEP